jgi:ABC-type branched-subunit amino acid transport system substrate-binding protein
VRYLIEEQDLTNLATIALRADYAREAQSSAERAIRNSDDGRLALSTTYELGKLDADAMAQQVIASDADAVLLWSHTVDALALLAALEANAWTGTLVYPYAPLELIDFASNTITVLTASNWSASAQDWLSLQFTADYTRTYGATPVAQAAAYYDAIYWVADGMTAVGAEPLELNTWLLDTSVFRGVQGVYDPVTYGAGETIRSVFIGQVHADGISELARYDGDTCLVGCDE